MYIPTVRYYVPSLSTGGRSHNNIDFRFKVNGWRIFTVTAQLTCSCSALFRSPFMMCISIHRDVLSHVYICICNAAIVKKNLPHSMSSGFFWFISGRLTAFRLWHSCPFLILIQPRVHQIPTDTRSVLVVLWETDYHTEYPTDTAALLHTQRR
jgi:hypothetical protein